MRIRAYQPDDDPDLMALERQSPRGLPEPFVHYRRRFIDRAALFPDHHVLVAEQDGAIAGVAAVGIKLTQIAGQPVTMGYVFDVRVAPGSRRFGFGKALLSAIDDILVACGAAGAYAHIVTTNAPPVHLFARQGYHHLRDTLLLFFSPAPAHPASSAPAHLTIDPAADRDRIRAEHGARDLFVPQVARQVADLGFERWSVEGESGTCAGISLFDQSRIFQQWPCDRPFAGDEALHRGGRNLRLFDIVGTTHVQELRAIFDALRHRAPDAGVGTFSLVIDRTERLPDVLLASAIRQRDYWTVFKPLQPGDAPDWQPGPLYSDPREL